MAPVFSWVRQWTSEQLQGTLVDIFVADDAGGVVHRIGEVEGVAGRVWPKTGMPQGGAIGIGPMPAR